MSLQEWCFKALSHLRIQDALGVSLLYNTYMSKIQASMLRFSAQRLEFRCKKTLAMVRLSVQMQ